MQKFQSTKKFSDLDGLPKCALQSLHEDFGYEYMSESQSLYMQAVINGQDVLVRAGTGSGKTLGFLLPLITKLVSLKGSDGPKAVILSPARELAEQTLVHAKKIASKCGICVVSLIGGVRSTKADIVAMNNGCDIIVATPGRLAEHIKDTVGFKEALGTYGRVLVLDEVDRLLDPGFKPVMIMTSNIMNHYARQTLLFTATATAAVREASKQFMHNDNAFIDAGVTNATGNVAQNNNILQEAIVVPSKKLISELWYEIQEEKKGKTVVFVQTAMMASLLAKIFGGMRKDVYELHSRMPQNKRSRTVKDFTESKNPAVLIATDVFARGIDIKGITFVVQLGIAPDNAQVAHRVGRTGRGGTTGRALMILSESENLVLQDLIDRERMPIHIRKTQFPSNDAPIFFKKENEIKKMACKAFVASIGFYKAHVKRLGWKSNEIVPHVAEMFSQIGVPDQYACPVSSKLIKKMGLGKDHGLKEI